MSGKARESKLVFDGRFNTAARLVAGATALVFAWLAGPVNAFAPARPVRRPVSRLAARGLTQTPDAALRKKIAAREAAERSKPRPPVRDLSEAEMNACRGSGPYRNANFAGSPMPWHKSLRDVNLSTGNLFKSFTDVQVAPGKGAGLVLQRTYNSQDEREGAFGIGWTHAYDIRIEEAGPGTPLPAGQTPVDEDGNPDAPDLDADRVPRTDFFGGKHYYTRDADGLYTPPGYMFDELDSTYDQFLASGPPTPLEDTQKGMDGTVKHFVANGTLPTSLGGGINHNERVCDSITDRHGNQTELIYGLTVTNPDGSTRKLLTQVKDPSQRTLTFTWNNLGTTAAPHWRVIQVQGPLYRVTYEYHSNPADAASYRNLWKVRLDRDGLDRATTYLYGSYTGANGTENGLLTAIVDPLGHSVQYSYALTEMDWHNIGNNNGNNPTGTVWVHRVTENAGVDGNDNPRTLYWDIFFRDISPAEFHVVCVSQVGHSFSVTRDAYGRILDIGHGVISHQPINFLRYTFAYDASNNVTESVAIHRRMDTSSGGYEVRGGDVGVTATYGPHGNVLTQQVVYGINTTAPIIASRTEYQYYNASKYFQKASVTQKGAAGNSDHRTSTFDYFDSGDADPGNRGQVKWVRDAGYANPNSTSYGRQWEYGYNQNGQKAWERNLKGVKTVFAYGDAWGNLTQVVQDPSDPSTSHAGLSRTTSMSYDVAGRVLSSTDPTGRTSNFAYNSLGQPETAQLPATANTPSETVTYGYGANGRTETVSDNRGMTTLAYEPGCDRVRSVTDPVTGTLSYTYMPSGERKTMTLPGGGGTVTYHYGDPAFPPEEGLYSMNSAELIWPKDDPNSIGLALTGITDDGAQGRRVDVMLGRDGRLLHTWFNQAFDGSGNRTRYCQSSYNYGEDYQASQYGRPELVQVRTRWHADATASSPVEDVLLSQNDYTYDAFMQRHTNTHSWTGQNNAVQSRTETYGYDEQSRLKTVNYGDGQSQGYGFDAMGNRTQKTESVGGSTVTEGYAFDDANRLVSRNGQAYTNDANGNTLSGGGRTNVWDSQNRLVQCLASPGGVSTDSTFAYGSDGLRRRMQVSTPAHGSTPSQVKATDYVLDGQSVVREIVNTAVSGGNPVQEVVTYLQGPNGPMYRRVGAATDVRWYVYDGLGSVVGEVDVNGSLTATKDRDVYGLTRSAAGTGTTSHGFVGSLGHQTDEVTGLVYMQARYYDPAVGRFASEDPACHGVNWFIYCDDDPVGKVDPTGKATEHAIAAVAAYLGAKLFDRGLSLIGKGHAMILAGGEMIETGRYLMALGDSMMTGPSIGAAGAGGAVWLSGEALEIQGANTVKMGVKAQLQGALCCLGGSILMYAGVDTATVKAVWDTVAQKL
jgi:RHS repeat-associated protein